ncbi:MAG TPA: cytochrome c biogenesis protein CcdA, partial [Propionibacteriaceae bacterium]|nr:cytochrome c biogenesis protein CcdA [Propionibacteriaceae bacterium]
AAYAVASLTCTIAPFLAIVVASFRTSSAWTGAALFVAYALGMGLMVGAAAVAVALARSSVISRLQRAGQWVPRIAGLLLVLVGAYVAYYGWWELRVLAGGATDDPVVGAASRLQAVLVAAVTALGPVWLVVLLVGLVGLGLVVRSTGRSRRLSNARKGSAG